MKGQQKSLTKSHPWTPSLQRIRSLNIREEEKDIISELITKAYIYNDISFELLNTRKRSVVDTHCVLATIIRDYFKLPLETVGKILDKHHATIIHYSKLYEEVLCLEDRSKKLYDKLADYAKYRMYGSDGYVDFDVIGKDNKELQRACRELISTNRALLLKLEKVKEVLNV